MISPISPNISAAVTSPAQGRPLKKKQKEFARFYATPGQEGYQCGAKAARLAGYAEKAANCQGVRLLKDVRIRQLVEQVGFTFSEKANVGREVTGLIAWQEFEKATENKDRQFWFQEVCKLNGHYVQRVEMKADTTISISLDDKAEILRLRKAIVEPVTEVIEYKQDV